MVCSWSEKGLICFLVEHILVFFLCLSVHSDQFLICSLGHSLHEWRAVVDCLLELHWHFVGDWAERTLDLAVELPHEFVAFLSDHLVIVKFVVTSFALRMVQHPRLFFIDFAASALFKPLILRTIRKPGSTFHQSKG